MKPWHKAFAAGVSLAVLTGLTAPRPAQAQLATVCVNCSTVVTQLLQYAKEAQSMVTQLGVPPGTLRFFTVGMAILGRFRPIFGPGGLGLADMAC